MSTQCGAQRYSEYSCGTVSTHKGVLWVLMRYQSPRPPTAGAACARSPPPRTAADAYARGCHARTHARTRRCPRWMRMRAACRASHGHRMFASCELLHAARRAMRTPQAGTTAPAGCSGADGAAWQCALHRSWHGMQQGRAQSAAPARAPSRAAPAMHASERRTGVAAHTRNARCARTPVKSGAIHSHPARPEPSAGPTTRNMRPSDAAKVKWQGCTQSAVQMW
jgi:hypothetical protein